MKNKSYKRGVLIFTIIFTIFTSNVRGQNHTEFEKIQLGVNFSPDFNYRVLRMKEEGQLAEYLLNHRNAYESAKLSVTTGINLLYNLNPIMGIETGIQYSNKGFLYQTNPELIFEDGSTINGIIQVSNFHFIDVPIRAYFNLGKGNLRFFSSVGLVSNVLLSATETTQIDISGKPQKSTDKQEGDFKRFNLSPMMSLGIDYRLTPKTNLRVEPTVRYGIFPVESSVLKTNLYNVGLNFGYYFRW